MSRALRDAAWRAVGTAYRHRMDAEDALLIRELPGYAEYAATTGRLLPRVMISSHRHG